MGRGVKLEPSVLQEHVPTQDPVLADSGTSVKIADEKSLCEGRRLMVPGRADDTYWYGTVLGQGAFAVVHAVQHKENFKMFTLKSIRPQDPYTGAGTKVAEEVVPRGAPSPSRGRHAARRRAAISPFPPPCIEARDLSEPVHATHDLVLDTAYPCPIDVALEEQLARARHQIAQLQHEGGPHDAPVGEVQARVRAERAIFKPPSCHWRQLRTTFKRKYGPEGSANVPQLPLLVVFGKVMTSLCAPSLRRWAKGSYTMVFASTNYHLVARWSVLTPIARPKLATVQSSYDGSLCMRSPWVKDAILSSWLAVEFGIHTVFKGLPKPSRFTISLNISTLSKRLRGGGWSESGMMST
ncbi:hypothetical protein BOTBODRAFT_42855 [Botryobasidium botryosum FD-172 SS1]|uniref:Protein kinase domain-containing protein n=1 Tax=Botryobasidium botryosum (strain FD-172 SS1) TaxID=930990 RepID=A0A067MPW1_BOTB1|nr:hypothetical protein BOTBODRAFT_42855 [Botryobasidium botryosum FD-172 SS1]